MGKNSAIAWTDDTFNPWWGCQKISPACDFCYAEAWAKRTGFPEVWTEPGGTPIRRTFGARHWAEPFLWNEKAARAGIRRRVFCASMADVFDADAPAGERERLFNLIRNTQHLDWLLLTKRIGNAKRMLPADWGAGYPNVWLGITVVNQEEAERDILKLLGISAAVRFLSCEPLLEPIYLKRLVLASGPTTVQGFHTLNVTVNALHGAQSLGWPPLDWVIVGGESGSKARPMPTQWAEWIMEDCRAAGVAFFFKQESQANSKTYGDFATFPEALQVRQWPTKPL